MRRGRGVLVLLTLTGCSTTWLIRPAELSRLDRWTPASGPVELQGAIATGDADEAVTFDADTTLDLETAQGQDRARLLSVRDDGKTFRADTVDSRIFVVPVATIDHAEIVEPPSPVVRDLEIAGILLVGAALAVGAAWAYYEYAPHARL
jgi:hypothetical protein